LYGAERCLGRIRRFLGDIRHFGRRLVIYTKVAAARA